MREAEASIVLLPFEPIPLVVDAARVHAIDDATRAGEAPRDLAALLDLDAPAGARRAIRVGREGAWLVVSATVVVRRLARAAFRPLPRWLAGIGERYPIASLVHLERGFAYELDVDRALAHGALPRRDPADVTS